MHHANDGGKGGGKGKGKKGDGKGRHPTSGSETENSRETTNPYREPLENFDGIHIEDVPADQRCCLHYAWGICKRTDCKIPHKEQCTKAMAKTKNYARLVKVYGDPVAYRKKKAEAKAKAKAAPASAKTTTADAKTAGS